MELHAGNAFEKAKVHDFVSKFKGVVCIDEAYADFCEDNCLDMVNKYPNVVVTRSLSKSYSLAGMRCGVGMGSVELIRGMHKVRDSYNVNHITQGTSVHNDLLGVVGSWQDSHIALKSLLLRHY